MTHELLHRFDDGSAIYRDPSTLRLSTEQGEAAVALQCVRSVVERPPADGLDWVPNARASLSREEFRTLLAHGYAERFSSEPFWLLRPQPVAWLPSSGDRRFARELEQRAREFDAEVQSHALDEPTEQRRRRTLLVELAQGGLLEHNLLARKVEALRELGLETLTSLAQAALTLWEYAESPERSRVLRGAAPKSLEALRLSLDWARRVTSAPPGFGLFEWWAVCENSFSTANPAGARGRAFVLQGPLAAELKWRSEDGSRFALYDAELRTRGTGA